jgi:hemerythrin-like domain-containing protein
MGLQSPAGPLIHEHRVIERAIASLARAVEAVERTRSVDPVFVDTVVDFIRTYADRCHHGKEEDILFRDLAKKKLSAEHSRIMDELVEEHKYARTVVGRLVDAKEKFLTGDEAAAQEVVACLKELSEFYPKHIEKEDKHFFFPLLDYFSKDEQDAMLIEFWEFDRKMIHDKYTKLVDNLEQTKAK